MRHPRQLIAWFCVAASLWMGVGFQLHGLAHSLHALETSEQHDSAPGHEPACEQRPLFASVDGALPLQAAALAGAPPATRGKRIDRHPLACHGLHGLRLARTPAALLTPTDTAGHPRPCGLEPSRTSRCARAPYLLPLIGCGAMPGCARARFFGVRIECHIPPPLRPRWSRWRSPHRPCSPPTTPPCSNCSRKSTPCARTTKPD